MKRVSAKPAGYGLGVVLATVTLIAMAEGSAMRISSPAFGQDAHLPVRFTCDGEGLSPPLQWTGVSEDAKTLALIVEDPDAPDPKAPKVTWIHWVLYDLPPDSPGIAEGADPVQDTGHGREGRNSWGRTGYGGACPPVGRHRYFFRLYALDTTLGDLHEPDAKTLREAMKGHVIGRASLMGTYQHGD